MTEEKEEKLEEKKSRIRLWCKCITLSWLLFVLVNLVYLLMSFEGYNEDQLVINRGCGWGIFKFMCMIEEDGQHGASDFRFHVLVSSLGNFGAWLAAQGFWQHRRWVVTFCAYLLLDLMNFILVSRFCSFCCLSAVFDWVIKLEDLVCIVKKQIRGIN